MNKIQAPFSDEQIKNLNKFQDLGQMHPFTCGGNRTDDAHKKYAEIHGGDYGQLIATKEGWICPVCDYKQNWAHDFMAQDIANNIMDLEETN